MLEGKLCPSPTSHFYKIPYFLLYMKLFLFPFHLPHSQRPIPWPHIKWPFAQVWGLLGGGQWAGESEGYCPLHSATLGFPPQLTRAKPTRFTAHAHTSPHTSSVASLHRHLSPHSPNPYVKTTCCTSSCLSFPFGTSGTIITQWRLLFPWRQGHTRG